MNKKVIACLCVVFAMALAVAAVSHAADEKSGSQVKSFWQKLFNYPANVTKESVNVAADTAKRGTAVVVNEVKTVGQVTSGNLEKTADLVTGPVTGVAETVVKTGEGVVKIPVEANKPEATK